MTLLLSRRVVMWLPVLLAACGDNEAPPSSPARRDFPTLRYGYLPPINLNVARLALATGFVVQPGDDEVIGSSPIDPAATLFAMARDRLKAVGNGGTATFEIRTASITRHRDLLNGVLAVRLNVRDADGSNTGFAEARVTATHAGPVRDQRAAIYDMMKSMMDDMNVELEYQLRNKLRTWVIDPGAASGSPSSGPSSFGQSSSGPSSSGSSAPASSSAGPSPSGSGPSGATSSSPSGSVPPADPSAAPQPPAVAAPPVDPPVELPSPPQPD